MKSSANAHKSTPRDIISDIIYALYYVYVLMKIDVVIFDLNPRRMVRMALCRRRFDLIVGTVNIVII